MVWCRKAFTIYSFTSWRYMEPSSKGCPSAHGLFDEDERRVMYFLAPSIYSRLPITYLLFCYLAFFRALSPGMAREWERELAQLVAFNNSASRLIEMSIVYTRLPRKQTAASSKRRPVIISLACYLGTYILHALFSSHSRLLWLVGCDLIFVSELGFF